MLLLEHLLNALLVTLAIQPVSAVVIGERKQNRTVYDFSYNNDSLREVKKFNELKYDHHQNDLSPLIPIVNCIDDFPLDYMHMVLLGVVKRALIFMLRGDKICKISQQQAIEITNRLILSRENIPSNFNRKPRPLDELCYWKATEYRLFLIHLGPVVLKNMVSSKLYRHFLSLHVALTLLLHEHIELNPELVRYAKSLLKWFTKTAKSVYGPLFNVYNVHSIVHIADDVLKHQCSLNEISSFQFENYLQTLKKMIRNGSNPIVQVVKRLGEIQLSSSLRSDKPNKCFKVNGKDNFFLSVDGEVCEIKKENDNGYECQVIKRNQFEPFYTFPIESSVLDILYLRNPVIARKKNKLLMASTIKKKMFRLSYKNGYVFFPLLHDIESNMY